MHQINQKHQEWEKVIKTYNRANLEEVYHKYLKIFEKEPVPRAWMPNNETTNESNIAKSIKELHLNNYQQFFRWAADNRAEYWEYAVKKLNIKFSRKYEEVLDKSKGPENTAWFRGASLNIVESCFQGTEEQTAVIEGRENGGELVKISYRELLEKVERVAGGLAGLGFKPGDTIVIYAPLSSEAIISYLALIKIGVIAVSVADSFSSEELKKRIEISKSKAVITSSAFWYGGKKLRIYEKVKEATEIPAIVLGEEEMLRKKDISYHKLLNSPPFPGFHYSGPDDFINILFSSGTTKEPKAIPFTQLTPIKCAADGYFHQNIRDGEVVSWTTGMGWMMAPWLIFAGLLNKAAISVYVGAATGDGYSEFVENSQITMLGTIPSIVRAWKKQDFHKKVNWKVKLFSSTGEPSNAEDYFYLMALAKFKAPIIEYCGGTEIGGGYISTTVLHPSSPCLFTTPTLGLDFCLLKPDGKIAGDKEVGEIFIIPPSVGMSQKLLNKDHFKEYYEGTPKGPKEELLRRHGDAFEVIHHDGMIFYRSVGRTDDVMNLGGIKISSVEIEEIINTHEDIFEAAAVSVPEEGGGLEKLLIFVVPEKEIQETGLLKKELQSLINKQLNPQFKIAEVILVEELPRTASNKVMRRELREKIKN